MPSPPSAALEILDRVRIQVDALARASGDDSTLVGMPGEISRHELPLTARRYYTTALRLMRTGMPATDEDLALARRRAAQRAQEGMPLELVLHNWHHAGRLLWQACVDAAGTEFAAGLGYIGHHLYALQDDATRAVVLSYQAAADAMADEAQGARRLIAQRLLSGHDATDEAGRLGLTTAPRYAVLTFVCPPLPSEPEQHVAREVAARRRVRSFSTALARQGGQGDVLYVLEAEGGRVLVPAPDNVADEVVLDRADALHRALREETRLDIDASVVAPAEPADLPGRAETGDAVLRLGRRLRVGGARRAHRLEDVDLAFQVTRPSPARALLAGLLDPLDAHQELVGTLRVWFRNDLDRARTAGALQVHPNTVNNRIRRAETLLGEDLSVFSAAMRVASAIMITDATRGPA